jgi:hypothetical protein
MSACFPWHTVIRVGVHDAPRVVDDEAAEGDAAHQTVDKSSLRGGESSDAVNEWFQLIDTYTSALQMKKKFSSKPKLPRQSGAGSNQLHLTNNKPASQRRRRITPR